MMHCTLAFLLLTKSRSQDSGFLALVNEYDQNSHYNVYDISHVKEFPVPNSGTNLYMTKSAYDGQGTYIATYCSESAKGHEIVTDVSHGLRAKFENLRESERNSASPVSRHNVVGGTANKCTADQAMNPEGDSGQTILSRTVADYQVSLAWVREELKLFCRKRGQAHWHSLSDIISREKLGGLIHRIAWYNSGPFAAVKNLLDENQNAGSSSGVLPQWIYRSASNKENILGKRIENLSLPKLTSTPEIFKYDCVHDFVDDFTDKLISTNA